MAMLNNQRVHSSCNTHLGAMTNQRVTAPRPMYRRPHAASSPAKAFKGKGRVLPSNSVIEAPGPGKMRFSWEFMGNNGGFSWD